MGACTFFGHRDTPPSAEPLLRSAILHLIEKRSVQLFYVGCQGSFDSMVRRQLEKISISHSIQFFIVQAYLPQDNQTVDSSANTLFPEGLECVPRRFAIYRRNIWMIDRSQYVITCTRYSTGNAEKMKQLAVKKGKTVISI